MRPSGKIICASVVVALAACGSPATIHASQRTSTTVAPSPRTTGGPAESTTTTPANMATVAITGSGGGAAAVTVTVNRVVSRHERVPLPYTQKLPASGGVAVEAQSADRSPDARITCTVTSEDGSTTTSTSSGSIAVVRCSV
jgi:hypothetical protein